MKMMNDMELDQITGGYVDVGGKPSDAEIEFMDNMVKSFYDSICNAFSILWYIYNK